MADTSAAGLADFLGLDRVNRADQPVRPAARLLGGVELGPIARRAPLDLSAFHTVTEPFARRAR